MITIVVITVHTVSYIQSHTYLKMVLFPDAGGPVSKSGPGVASAYEVYVQCNSDKS